jgi:hypothetical protein
MRILISGMRISARRDLRLCWRPWSGSDEDEDLSPRARSAQSLKWAKTSLKSDLTTVYFLPWRSLRLARDACLYFFNVAAVAVLRQYRCIRVFMYFLPEGTSVEVMRMDKVRKWIG